MLHSIPEAKEQAKETTWFQTKRATVPALEEVLYEPFPVLDHGFIRVIDYFGDDAAIVQAARVSYGKGTKQVNQDRGLINYLMRHRHTTPFEMCEIKFHIKLPMFVARQWIRHRTANVNEYSARYSILDKEFYIPPPEAMAPQSTTNNQGRAEEVLPTEDIQRYRQWFIEDAQQCYDHYELMINQRQDGSVIDESKNGLTRELARMNLPVNCYTQWYWKIDLHNLLHFINLRADSHAQYEIRAYAEILSDIVAKWVPMAFNAFKEYRRDGVHLSAKAKKYIEARLKGETIPFEQTGMTQREWQELKAAFNGIEL